MTDKLNRGVYGQKRIMDSLFKIYKSKNIPHAFIFSGKKGLGKFYTAINFLQLINSNLSITILDQISKLREPYVKLLFPLPKGRSETTDDNPFDKLEKETVRLIQDEIAKKSANPFYEIQIEKANSIKISSVRDVIRTLTLSFDEAEYRSVIIMLPEKMSSEAQNALLKTLEEPPEKVVFFLLSENINGVLPTIVSRCWKYNFDDLNNNEISAILTDYFPEYSGNELIERIGECSSVQEAIEFINSDLSNENRLVIEFLRHAIAGNYYTSSEVVKTLTEKDDKTNITRFLVKIYQWFSDSIKERNNFDRLYDTDNYESIAKFNARFPDADIEYLLTKIDYSLQLIDSTNVALNIILMNVIFEVNNVALKE